MDIVNAENIVMFTEDEVNKILGDYSRLRDELHRILSIMDSGASSINSVSFNGEVFEVQYDYSSMGQWDSDCIDIAFSLFGKTSTEIKQYVAEQQRIKTEKDRQEHAERVRQNELTELNRLQEKYPQNRG